MAARQLVAKVEELERLERERKDYAQDRPKSVYCVLTAVKIMPGFTFRRGSHWPIPERLSSLFGRSWPILTYPHLARLCEMSACMPSSSSRWSCSEWVWVMAIRPSSPLWCSVVYCWLVDVTSHGTPWPNKCIVFFSHFVLVVFILHGTRHLYFLEAELPKLGS